MLTCIQWGRGIKAHIGGLNSWNMCCLCCGDPQGCGRIKTKLLCFTLDNLKNKWLGAKDLTLSGRHRCRLLILIRSVESPHIIVKIPIARLCGQIWLTHSKLSTLLGFGLLHLRWCLLPPIRSISVSFTIWATRRCWLNHSHFYDEVKNKCHLLDDVVVVVVLIELFKLVEGYWGA